ncbi:MAG: formate dehydrogenase accessory protein FdhE [Planctomycetes bacterium]|nr:formate dehydrogenase accessory protein FdhE [Planctomycetota bacterium]
MSAIEESAARTGAAAVAERLEALIGREQVSEDYVRARIDLMRAQRKALDKLSAAPADAGLGKRGNGEPNGDAATHPGAAEPLVAEDALHLDQALLAALLADFRSAVEEHGGQSEDLKRLSAAASAESGLLEQLTRKSAFGPNWQYLEATAERIAVAAEALLFFGRTLAAPFLAAAAGASACWGVPFAGGPGAASTCRACGSPPGLAMLRRDDGKRVLFCSLCGTSWMFPRVKCVSCGNHERETHGLLRISEGDARWIETCDKCKNYIKTIDERRLPLGEEVLPLVEDTGTLHLDMLAEREGFARKLPYAAPW